MLEPQDGASTAQQAQPAKPLLSSARRQASAVQTTSAGISVPLGWEVSSVLPSSRRRTIVRCLLVYGGSRHCGNICSSLALSYLPVCLLQATATIDAPQSTSSGSQSLPRCVTLSSRGKVVILRAEVVARLHSVASTVAVHRTCLLRRYPCAWLAGWLAACLHSMLAAASEQQECSQGLQAQKLFLPSGLCPAATA